MSQAIELIAGSTAFTLLITSASQVPHKLVILDEIPETVQACLTKWLFQRKPRNKLDKPRDIGSPLLTWKEKNKPPKKHFRHVMRIWYFGIFWDSLPNHSLKFMQQFVLFLKSILLHVLHVTHKHSIWARKMSNTKRHNASKRGSQMPMCPWSSSHLPPAPGSHLCPHS